MTQTPPVNEFLESRVAAGAPEGELEFFRATIQQPDEVAMITVLLASEQGRALHGQVFTMTRDSLALLRPEQRPVGHRRRCAVDGRRPRVGSEVADLVVTSTEQAT